MQPLGKPDVTSRKYCGGNDSAMMTFASCMGASTSTIVGSSVGGCCAGVDGAPELGPTVGSSGPGLAGTLSQAANAAIRMIANTAIVNTLPVLFVFIDFSMMRSLGLCALWIKTKTGPEMFPTGECGSTNY